MAGLSDILGALSLPLRAASGMSSAMAAMPQQIATADAQRQLELKAKQADLAYVLQQRDALSKLLASMPADEQAAYLTNPAEAGKANASNYAAQNMHASDTIKFGGANGPSYTAPAAPMQAAPSASVFDPVTNTFSQAPAAPVVAAPSNSVIDLQTGKITTAPAEPKVVTSNSGQNVDIVDPNVARSPARGAAPQPPGSAPARGLRNNNPLNIKLLGGNQKYAGQTGADGPFATFGTTQAGMQAADRLLQSKQALHGFNTVGQVVADPKFGWDPGNTAYAQQVAAAMGIKPDAPIDLNDSQVRASMMHAMMPIEIGRGSPAPASAQGTSGIMPVRQGGAPQQVSPQEARTRGLAPGIWFKNPDGAFELKSPAPKGDVDRVNNLVAAASTMDDVSALDDQFMQAAGRTAPGLQYAGGNRNPIAMIAEHVNPDVKTMESISAQQLFKMKPENAGARILQSELPFWEKSAVDPGSSLSANQAIVAHHATDQKQMMAKSEFYQNWIYQHGNLAGADQAWAKAKPKPARTANAPLPTLGGGGFKVIGQQ